MKVLLIGMDGCHEDVFKRGWTPFITELMSKYRHLDIENDLLSRGWLEISLGEHAINTKALYDRPKSNGTLEWTKKFSLPEVPNLGVGVKPLWQKLNEKGYSVGVVNVPTTFPAPKVNGFFISGGGGGAPVVESATEELCYPKEILSTLADNKYIVDNRFYELVVDKKLSTSSEILSRLSYKNERRTDTFIEVNKKYNVDFGFIVYKTASVLAESFYSTEMCRRTNEENLHDQEVMHSLEKYYRNFDEQIERLADCYPEAEIVFVSDHGTVEHTHSVNPNVLLREQGLQKFDYRKALLKKAMVTAKALIPFGLKPLLKRHVASAVSGVGEVDFTPSATKAFCRTLENWNHGIYINDNKRFGGPVREKDFESVRAQIIRCINEHPDSVKHGVSASATSDTPGQMYDYYPDVEVHIPNGYLTFDRGREYISEYKAPTCRSCLETFMSGEMLYMKSHSPIAAMSDELASAFSADQLRGDLTVIHHRVVDIMDRC